jgi:hypothetical protein
MQKFRFVLLIVVLLVPMSILYAQCDIDLHTEMLMLMSAQIQADTGDTATAAATLEELSVTLNTIAEGCASAEMELPQQYVAQDNSIAFRYPVDWVIDASDPFGYILGSSQSTLDTALDSDVPSLDEGEMVIVIFPTPLFNEDFKSLAGDMSDDFLGSEFEVIESLTPTVIAGREAFHGVYEYEGELRVVLEIIHYSDAVEPSMIILFGISKVADAALLQSYLTAVAQSIEYPPQQEVQSPETTLRLY